MPACCWPPSRWRAASWRPTATTGRIPTAITTTDAPRPAGRKPAGRPPRAAAPLLTDAILHAATGLFLRDGVSATSIESIAQAAGVSKRTLYARFPDKASILQVAMTRLIGQWLQPDDAADPVLAHPDELGAALGDLGRRMIAAALSPGALALHRLVVAEAGRIPALAGILEQSGAATGLRHVAALFRQAGAADPGWLAEQFQTLVVSGPQRRALGLGAPLSPAQADDWVDRSVRLVLAGAGATSSGRAAARPCPSDAAACRPD